MLMEPLGEYFDILFYECFMNALSMPRTMRTL